MLENPEVVPMEPRSVARIYLDIPRDRIQHEMRPGLMELCDALAAQGVRQVGPWFTHHLRMLPDRWNFEICLPIAGELKPVGRVTPGQVGGTSVARAVLHGPYEGLGEGWGALMGWIEAQGLQPAEDLYEVYLVGPESGGAPDTWRTELLRPLR